jgi:chorismate lyase/3-hydroxybenzoate synthase
VLFEVLDAKIIRQVNTSSPQKHLLDISYQQRKLLPDVLDDPHTLAVIDFAEQSQATEGNRIVIGTPALAGSELVEVWRTQDCPERGRFGAIHYRQTADLVFGQLQLASDSDSMQNITRDVYQQITELQQELAFPCLIRIWNFLPWINREDDGMERYQSFCVGRYQSIDTTRGYEEHLPAATAVGTHDDSILVYFLAARAEGLQIENHRQVSAFQYPPRYAPRSPAFSRAIVKQWGAQKHLYISGTASILGHESQHIGLLREQIDECLNNMDILIQEADSKVGLGISTVAELTGIKLYLRDADFLQTATAHIKQRIGEKVQLMVLHADICRLDLLLEIEGLYAGRPD